MSDYKIILNHYTDGISGHFNITFAAVENLADLTVGINLINEGSFLGFRFDNLDGVIANENFKLDDYLTDPTKEGYLQRKEVIISEEQYELLRSEYSSRIGEELNYVAYAHVFWGENCTLLPEYVLDQIGISQQTGDYFSFNELSQSQAGMQVWDNLTSYKPTFANSYVSNAFYAQLYSYMREGLRVDVNTMPVILSLMDEYGNIGGLDNAKQQLKNLGYTDEEINYEIPENAEIRCFSAGTLIDMADGSRKPIEQIEVGDEVLAYDPAELGGLGELKAARVTRTMVNQVEEIIDFHGVKMTPGHATLCGDGPHQGRHIPIMDILVADGAIVNREGELIRAATNLPVGSDGDRFVKVAYILDKSQKAYSHGRIRLGTRMIGQDGGDDWRVMEALEREGYVLHPDGLISKGGETPHPLYWFGPLPKPEDYVLAKSRLTIGNLYSGQNVESSSAIGADLPRYAGMTVQ
jgi:hypothetical protein|tara:strand:- start:18106 stop:19503 length:1398 start_codon:yes stop_codon:yes gene_type:complete